MTRSEVLQILHRYVESGRPICTDSRQVAPGAVFFALKGDNFNGNHFAEKALENGCIAAVIDEPVSRENNKVILVENVLETLQQLSIYHRKQFTIPVLAITGSNGKTTTKELVHSVLGSTFKTLATEGNLNNHIGVPLTLLRLNGLHEMAIIEMGANHVGEIEQLSGFAYPTYGLITNIGKAHLEGFGSLENILKGKTELYRHISSENGLLFVNGDNLQLSEKAKGTKQIVYGQSEAFHCSGRITGMNPFLTLEFRVNKPLGKTKKGISGQINTKLIGAYNFENILASIAIGLYFGVSPEKAISAIEAYQPVNNRSQLIKNQRNTVILDAYNANPTSMAAAISNFAEFGIAPRAVLLGDMLEMGSDSQAEHQQIVELLKERKFEINILVGTEFMKTICPNSGFETFNNSVEATAWLKENPLNGFHILVKGSRGIRMEKTLEAL